MGSCAFLALISTHDPWSVRVRWIGVQEAALRSVVGVQSADEGPRGHSGARPFSPHRGPVRTSKLQAQSEFGGKRWTQSFGNYLGEKRGSDLASVVRVGVGRVQST